MKAREIIGRKAEHLICRPRDGRDDNSWLWAQAGREFPYLWVMIRPRHVGGGNNCQHALLYY